MHLELISSDDFFEHQWECECEMYVDEAWWK